MDAFEEGYHFCEEQLGVQVAVNNADDYAQKVNEEINKLLSDLNRFSGFKTDSKILKGDVAEYWHSDTFNINAVARNSASRTYVNRSHDLGSVDISSNFGEKFGLKYYKDGVASAKQQAKSIYERYMESKAKCSLDEYFEKFGYTDDTVLHDPIYQGQIRVIPKDQLEEACDWLRHKITIESANRPEQAKRYSETLKLLTDCLKDGKGTESIPLSEKTAKELAALSKQGDITAEKLVSLGVSPQTIIRFEYLIREAFRSGLTSAIITSVMSIAPIIYQAIDYLVVHGEIDENQFRHLGVAALNGSSLGF